MLKNPFYIKDKTSYPKPTSGWAVDASTTITNPGPSEYRCVNIATGEIIFNTKIGFATNNQAEFLAVVQAIILSHSQGIKTTIYSDSQTAICWFRKAKYNTMLKRDATTEGVFDLLDESIEWLKESRSKGIKLNVVEWWATPIWGEIVADYNRK